MEYQGVGVMKISTVEHFFILFVILPVILVAQHKVNLNSGDLMAGQVEQILNDTLYFKYRGNQLKIPLNEVQSITFNGNTVPSNDIVTEVKGVVTYFFNDNFGDRPDVGAVVSITKSDSNKAAENLIAKYQIAKLYRRVLSLGIKNQKMIETLKKMDCYTDEGFRRLDKDASLFLIKEIVLSDKFKRVTVTGNGNYSIKLSPGTYEMVIISKGRKYDSLTELSGQVYWKLFTIKSGEDLTIDHQFNIE